MDSEIGKLITRLKQFGLYDDTLIVITSDHGEAFGDHDIVGHTVTSVFQDGAHIPLLVKYPGQHEGQRSDTLVSHVDLMPTILDAAGCTLPAGLQGRALRLPRDASNVVFSEAYAMGEHDRNTRLRGVRRGIFTDSAKLIAWNAGPPEFYDLIADPGETTNRYLPGDPAVADLSRRLTAWTMSIPRQLPKPAKLDKSTVDRIRSLGYVQ
jgi:arylsulfatase A-like enzyme